MKKYLLLLFAFGILNFAQAITYYTCSTSGQNTTNPDGTTGCATSTAWNSIGNELIIRNGTTFTLSSDLTIDGDIIIETGGTLGTTSNNVDITINGTVTVEGEIDFSNKNNCTIIIENGGTLDIKSGGEVKNNGGNNNSLVTVKNGGTILVEGSLSSTGSITVESGGSLTGSGSVESTGGSIAITGDVAFIDNLSVAGNLTGTGNVTIERNFTRTGWQQMGFPVALGKTLADLAFTGFTLDVTTVGGDVTKPTNTTNAFVWNASTASWEVATSGTSLVAQTFNFFISSTPASVSVTMTQAEFNNVALAQNYTYFNPGPSTTPPGNGIGWTSTITDGWNMWTNPYQAYLESDNLTLPADLVGGVYVWDGTQYLTRNGGAGAAEFIGPHQAFFVRTPANNGSFSIPSAARNISPASDPNYFKTSNELELELSGNGVQTSTFLVQNPMATNAFDGEYDAYYFFGANTVFNTVGVDSTAYSVNQVPQLNNAETYVSFYHPQNNKTFTISIDQNKSGSFGSVILQDLFTGAATDLKNGDYTFTSTTAAPAQRFKLMFTECPASATFRLYGLNKFWKNAGANDPNMFYHGVSQGKRIRANASGGVGPYIYTWSNNMGYTLKNQSSDGRTIMLFEPQGPSWNICEITDIGTGCTFKDSVFIDWTDQYYCGDSTNKWKLKMCMNGTNVCMPWSQAKAAIKAGTATLGNCSGPQKTLGSKEFSAISLYPNPASDFINISALFGYSSAATIQIFDLNGKLLQARTMKVDEGEFEYGLQVGNLTNGIYIVRLGTNREVIVERFQVVK